MAVNWTEMAYVVGGALLTSLLRGQISPKPSDVPAHVGPDGRPTSCVRTPRFVVMNDQCHNVIDGGAVQMLWCDQQDKAASDDDFYWPWSSPGCG